MAAHSGTEPPAVAGEPSTAELKEALRIAAAALLEAEVPFSLCGSLAGWARGGPLTRHDIDLCVKPEDADRALEVLADAGMRTEHPPEGWLFKAYHEGVLIDLLFAPAGVPVTDEVLDRAEERGVWSMRMRVAALEDIVTTKLLAAQEHALGYEGLLEFVRAIREQIDWPTVSAQTQGSPYARAFFRLLEELEIIERGATAEEQGARAEPPFDELADA